MEATKRKFIIHGWVGRYFTHHPFVRITLHIFIFMLHHHLLSRGKVLPPTDRLSSFHSWCRTYQLPKSSLVWAKVRREQANGTDWMRPKFIAFRQSNLMPPGVRRYHHHHHHQIWQNAVSVVYKFKHQTAKFAPGKIFWCRKKHGCKQDSWDDKGCQWWLDWVIRYIRLK